MTDHFQGIVEVLNDEGGTVGTIAASFLTQTLGPGRAKWHGVLKPKLTDVAVYEFLSRLHKNSPVAIRFPNGHTGEILLT